MAQTIINAGTTVKVVAARSWKSFCIISNISDIVAGQTATPLWMEFSGGSGVTAATGMDLRAGTKFQAEASGVSTGGTGTPSFESDYRLYDIYVFNPSAGAATVAVQAA
jgi:hypothetical protein